MDIRVLRYCEAVARLGNITHAADELHVAQPALSVAIKKLETELGVTLFARSRNRPVTLTPEGALLMRRAKRMFQELESARTELADARELRAGSVRVGMPPMYGLRYFPSLMKAFHARYPGIDVTAIEGSAGEIKTLLENGKVDLAIIEARRVEKGWARKIVGEEEVVLCVAASHALARKRHVEDTDLDGLPMVLFEGSFLQRNVLDNRCQKAGVKYRAVLQSNSVPMVYQAVADGLGAATLLRSMVEEDERLVPLSFEPAEFFRFDLCWLDEQYISRANQAFVDFATARTPR
ncbi:DNA-binding transcriptional regulator CynR [Caballeronia terrestris]|uniref:DNA-binding transcriptional regulator CynR n=1 Tax=Caballeronia terrestris TaxID=1226301 RepID=A0A158J4T2_9BURK|nr:LysR family transcriptional regulator [Caballeronia terrestris]SAL63369.1 DNA-binding transcriptional regulator CynR [Caballeronia terrestris]